MLKNARRLSSPLGRRRAWPRAALAAMTIIQFLGWESKASSDWSTVPRSGKYGTKFNRTPSVDQTSATTYGQTASTKNYFTEKAKKNKLPQRYLSEARVGITTVDTTLARAHAAELERDATVRRPALLGVKDMISIIAYKPPRSVSPIKQMLSPSVTIL